MRNLPRLSFTVRPLCFSLTAPGLGSQAVLSSTISGHHGSTTGQRHQPPRQGDGRSDVSPRYGTVTARHRRHSRCQLPTSVIIDTDTAHMSATTTTTSRSRIQLIIIIISVLLGH